MEVAPIRKALMNDDTGIVVALFRRRPRRGRRRRDTCRRRARQAPATRGGASTLPNPNALRRPRYSLESDAHGVHVSTPATQPTLLQLRHRYRRAYTSYLSCVKALSDVAVKATRPSQELLDSEASSLREMNEAREALLSAIFEQIDRAP
jgi:hypothetical protein